ncbi:unnamed protein product [Cylicocyclus nassatus]|uniref:Uncharacterized protein n=1 Tax=Cylicocyclus nassatus TaxID=53992 RepID=A0AA36GJ50_CYLNA|nr:unnamed protein product [Cylicocyclus nassatus]
MATSSAEARYGCLPSSPAIKAGGWVDRGYSEGVSTSGNETKQLDELYNAADLISGGIELIRESRDALQILVDKLDKQFDDLNVKGNRKELLAEIEEIDKDTQYSGKIAAANDTMYVLKARLNETRTKAKRLAKKLDMPVHTETVSTSSDAAMKGEINGEDGEFSANAGAWLSEDLLINSVVESEDMMYRTLKPKQLKIPRFYGDEEEFAEYWAIFSTLDSLKGRAVIAVKGIEMVPKNYQWIIETLKKKYSNRPVNRARVVQKLVDMRPATNTAESCSDTHDKIRMLINQLVSAGQDIRKMQDALWTEKILEKFPYIIVKNVLTSTQEL